MHDSHLEILCIQNHLKDDHNKRYGNLPDISPPLALLPFSYVQEVLRYHLQFWRIVVQGFKEFDRKRTFKMSQSGLLYFVLLNIL